MALMIAGERSGVGKTTITLSLLAALAQNSTESIQSFKVGPDYIDPMFHQALTGRPCRNLDVILTSEAYVEDCFARHSQACSFAVIEGVMGLFDGANDEESQLPWDRGSTAHIADLLKLPILLVVNASGTSRSIAALVQGYQQFAPQLSIAGVVLNRVSSLRHLELLTNALNAIQMPILGVFYRQADITIPDRHLGLVPTGELEEFGTIQTRLAELGAKSFNWDSLLPLLRTKPTAQTAALDAQVQARQTVFYPPNPNPKLRLGVAQDAAFNFYYADNLDILGAVGFELVAWSPLEDKTIPDNLDGLYLGGGFPEMFAAQLSQNHSLLRQLDHRIAQGLPTYAECGGLMYLAQAIVDFAGNHYPMVGILPTVAQMGQHLTLGYRQARPYFPDSETQEPPEQTWLLAAEVIWGHEFHRSSLSQEAANPLYMLKNYDGRSQKTEGWQLHHLIASYVHLHFAGCPQIPQRFWQTCWHYQQSG